MTEPATDQPFPAPLSTPIALSVRTHERAGVRRTDDAWLAQAWADAGTRVVPVARRQLPVTDDGAGLRWLAPSDLVEPATPAELAEPLDPAGSADSAASTGQGQRLFLGERDDVPHFAWLLVGDDGPAAPLDDGRWSDMRGVLATLAEPDAGFAVHAMALAEWHASHHFCPRCGGALRSTAAGHVLVCDDCGRQQFPRSDPAVIMMVTDGDRGLFGRQASWPEGRYSTLAGFVDPGESLEEAVIREVAEETAVVVTDATYFGSQPWPFPASLMVGFFARATSTEITVDEHEISDARWLTRDEVRTEAEAGRLALPGGASISRSLIEAWYGAALPGSW